MHSDFETAARRLWRAVQRTEITERDVAREKLRQHWRARRKLRQWRDEITPEAARMLERTAFSAYLDARPFFGSGCCNTPVLSIGSDVTEAQ